MIVHILIGIIMSRIGQLVRRTLPEPPGRKKIAGVNMAARKEIRRLKRINIFSR